MKKSKAIRRFDPRAFLSKAGPGSLFHSTSVLGGDAGRRKPPTVSMRDLKRRSPTDNTDHTDHTWAGEHRSAGK
jgi:hypothetical protein